MEHELNHLAFFLGGARSGKSQFAEKCANKWNRVAYYATALKTENSPEWEDRIAKHKERRPTQWVTIESCISIEEVVQLCQENNFDALLIDCLTLWMGAQVLKNMQSYSNLQLIKHLENETVHFLDQLKLLKCPILIVSDEVGAGVVPASESGRVFREALGQMNFMFGEKAKTITYSIAGQNLLIKGAQFKNNIAPLCIVNENYIYETIR